MVNPWLPLTMGCMCGSYCQVQDRPFESKSRKCCVGLMHNPISILCRNNWTVLAALELRPEKKLILLEGSQNRLLVFLKALLALCIQALPKDTFWMVRRLSNIMGNLCPCLVKMWCLLYFRLIPQRVQ